MECDEVRPELVGYLERELAPDKQRALEGHLDHCYYCLEELREIEAVVEACRRVLRHPRPRSRVEAMVPHLHPAPVVRALSRAQRYRHRRGRLMAAANVAVAMAASLIVIAACVEPVSAAVKGFAALAEEAASEIEAPAAEPGQAGEPNLVAWRQRILWANSLSAGARPPNPSAEEAEAPEEDLEGPEAMREPVSLNQADQPAPPPIRIVQSEPARSHALQTAVA